MASRESVADQLRQRLDLAVELERIPTACWSDLCGWAERGYVVRETEFGELEREFTPNVATGAQCALEAAVHPHRSCYCGKFRAGMEVSDARA